MFKKHHVKGDIYIINTAGTNLFQSLRVVVGTFSNKMAFSFLQYGAIYIVHTLIN